MFFRFLANLFLIWAFAILYFFTPYYNALLSAEAKNTIFNIAIGLSLISLPEAFYLTRIKRLNFGLKIYLSIKQLFKAWAELVTGSKFKLGITARKNLLFTLVKFFFLPIMVKFFVANFKAIQLKVEFLSTQDQTWLSIDFFNNHFYGFALAFIFFIDTVIFAFGYLFEASWLKNKVRSVDSTISGWAVTLICYPPFVLYVGQLIPWGANDYAFFLDEETTFGIRILLLTLLIGYVAATLSLGTKCSNLTNRGIVTTGAYRLVRHPAYICKNLFWWIALIPAATNNPWLIVGMAFWTVIYFLRAVTEERHLKKDKDYLVYCEQVKWRFLPGII